MDLTDFNCNYLNKLLDLVLKEEFHTNYKKYRIVNSKKSNIIAGVIYRH